MVTKVEDMTQRQQRFAFTFTAISVAGVIGLGVTMALIDTYLRQWDPVLWWLLGISTLLSITGLVGIYILVGSLRKEIRRRAAANE
jgi:hypothetical protein